MTSTTFCRRPIRPTRPTWSIRRFALLGLLWPALCLALPAQADDWDQAQAAFTELNDRSAFEHLKRAAAAGDARAQLALALALRQGEKLFAGAVQTDRAAARRWQLALGQPALLPASQVPPNKQTQAGLYVNAVQAWLMRQAKRVFQERLDHFAPLLGVQWNKLALSNAGTRWGSARVDGSIRLNWRLIHLRLSVLDYVVAHELAHLREMNHSPRFWDVVRSVLPDFEQARGSLKDGLVPLLD